MGTRGHEDAGTRGLGETGRWGRGDLSLEDVGRQDVRSREDGDTVTRGRGNVRRENGGTRGRGDSGLEDVILTRSVYFHLLLQCHCFPYLVLAFVFKFIVV